MADPLDDARALVVLARLLHRARTSAARCGVQGSAELARELVPVGRALTAAVAAAEAAPGGSADRQAALERVNRAGSRLWAMVDDQREGIRSLIGEACAGVRNDAPAPTGAAAPGLGMAGVSAAPAVGPGVVPTRPARKRRARK